MLSTTAQHGIEAALRKSYRIALVLETYAEHNRSVMRGVSNFADRQSSWELHAVPVARNEASILRAAMRADGVITRAYLDEMVNMLIKARKPTVVFHYLGPRPIPSVGSNPVAVAKLALDHLTSQGFRRLAFFGVEGRQFSTDRGNAFLRAARQRGCACEIFNGGTTDPETIDWYAPDKRVVQWLARLPKPVGILAANDVLGQQVLLASTHAGVRVPDDAAVVGVDNDELICRMARPRLSSIDYSGEEIGFIAAAMLDRLLRGRKLRRSRVLVDPARLIVRQSSDVLAVSDASVAEAVRFIRENTHRRLGVEDVMGQVPVARRTLEISFKKLLGRSIHDEIVESRLRKARQLLVETEMSIPDISEECGFCNRSHLSDVFTARIGQAPAAYRRDYRNPR